MSRHFLFQALLLIVAVAGCAGSALHAVNLIPDPRFDRLDSDWLLSGQIVRRAGVGPGGSTVLYVPGDGRPSGYRSAATFLASVEPGKTYTFSAYIDATDHVGEPPYVSIAAVNGGWRGATVDQRARGRVATTFTIPSDSGTTLVHGTFDTANGLYPVGHGVVFAQPQLESGENAHAFSDDLASPLRDPPASGNLVVDSDARRPADWWQCTGAMRMRGGAAVYAGDGGPAGFASSAAFFATVSPGETYTFSLFMDGSADPRTPPYAFLAPMNGTWDGAQLYSGRRGRVFTTFTIPASSQTTMLRGWVTPQNGWYPRGAMFVAAAPQIEIGDVPHAYVAGGELPPSRNLVVDSDARAPQIDWRIAGAMHVQPTGAIVYAGDGRPSGYANSATFFARVASGKTYTLSASLDGIAHAGTPPYIFIRAVDGSWAGAQVYQSGAGRVFTTFSIPQGAGTTCISGTVTPQDGVYPPGAQMRFAHPQVEEGTTFGGYAPTAPAPLAAAQKTRCP